MQKKSPDRPDAGVALFVALSLLLVFSMLGTAYVKYMNVELKSTQVDIQKLRGKHLGQSGVYAAIGEIEAAIAHGEAPAGSYQFDMPVYRMQKADDGVTLEQVEFPQSVKAQVSDESGLVNLNHAPDAVLTALKVPQSVINERRGRNFRPFVSVDDLRSRDLMNSQDYAALDRGSLTVYTGDKTGANVNLNAAGPNVLSAIFNITVAEAEALSGKRPFTSWEDVVEKVGRAPSTYRVPSSGQSMPAGLSLTSDCYRILSTANMITTDTSRNGLDVDVEAVVRFSGEGFSVRFWTESPANITITSNLPSEAVESDSAAEAPDAEAEPAEESTEDAGEPAETE